MSTFRARCAAVSLGTSIAVVGALVAATCFPSKPLGQLWSASVAAFRSVETRLAIQGKLRDTAARAELGLRRDDAWPGVYRTVGIWPTELVLAPRSGFTLHHDSRCGNCKGFAAFGQVVTASEDELQLEAELSHECATTRDHLAATLHLVRWGDLLFAVTPQRIESFCAAVAGGRSFPSNPLRVLGDTAFDFDAPQRPDARPVVPSEWQHLLPTAPIEARVAKLVELRLQSTESNASFEYYEGVFELDRGSDAGLAIGMCVFVEPPPNRLASSARIDEVQRESARFTLFVNETERAWAEALVGKLASTLRPPDPVPSR